MLYLMVNADTLCDTITDGQSIYMNWQQQHAYRSLHDQGSVGGGHAGHVDAVCIPKHRIHITLIWSS